MKRLLIGALLLFATTTTLFSQEPLWQGKGRIAISSDGNEHDHDDWAATPLTLALIASQRLQDRLAVYVYIDHIWGSNYNKPEVNVLSAYEHMRESALGGAREFGFDPKRFVCGVDNPEVAYRRLTEQINLSSEDNPLFILGAGPMQVIGEAINRSEVERRKYVTVITHSKWNNNHADHNRNWWDIHSGWRFDEMKSAFGDESGGGVTFVQILNQNGGEGYQGLFAPREMYDWVKSSSARNNRAYRKGSWDWLYTRLESCINRRNKIDNFDPSDAGMAIFLFTGVEMVSPESARHLLENPK